MRTVSIVIALFTHLGFTAAAAPQTAGVDSRTADVNGVKIHYFIAGHGPGLLLIHGYTQDSRMWLPAIPDFAKRFTVVAPDLPGIGESAVPAEAATIESASERIHMLAISLSLREVEIVGHDIGLMVAYAYAAKYRAEVKKLALLDAFLPGIGEWHSYYDDPHMWHFRFHGSTPESLVEGRERIYFEHYWNDFAANASCSLSETDRYAYAASYARPGRIRAGWNYFDSFPQTATYFAELGHEPLRIPVLSIGGEKASGDFLARQVKLIAVDAKIVVLKNTGHWLMEESRKETLKTLADFL